MWMMRQAKQEFASTPVTVQNLLDFIDFNRQVEEA